MSFSEFSSKIKEQQQKTNDIKEFNIMKRENTQEFSLANIIKNAGNASTADLGFEVENYFNKSNGRFVLPPDFGARFNDSITTTTQGAGAIATEFRDDLLIEEVKKESPLLSECSWLDGLSQRVEIPRNNSNITADFVEEGQSRDSENLSFDKIILEPHTLLATIRITRTMMNMSAFGLESFAYKAMKFAIRKKLEEVILYGKGVIKGIFEISGVPSIAGYMTAPTLEKTLSFGDTLENNNGNIANAKFALKNSDVSKLKATARGMSNEKMLIEELGNLQGYPYFTTQLIKSGDVVFGDFKDIFIGSFKGIELLTHNERGGDIILELYLDVDAKLAREKSFVISKTSA
jgi:phage capsid family